MWVCVSNVFSGRARGSGGWECGSMYLFGLLMFAVVDAVVVL